MKFFFRKWITALKILPFAIIAVILKLVFHRFGWEVLSLNPLFTGLIAASVFLLGFLISGVLADYKESEKIPTELATNLESLFQEVSVAYQKKHAAPTLECMKYILKFVASLKKWLYEKEATQDLLYELTGLNQFFLAFDRLTEISYVVRMKGDQSAIRRNIIRADIIRVTTFVPSGYALAEATIFVITLGLVLVKMDVYLESLFFVGMIVFVLVYMMALIWNLENPFDYSNKLGVQDEVSLKPLDDVEQRMSKLLASLKPRKRTQNQGRRARR